jgi:hypothetical protein
MTPTNIASKIAIAHEASLQERERGRLQLEESLRKSNAALAAEVVQLRERIAELEAESRDFKALGKRCEEAEQQLAEANARFEGERDARVVAQNEYAKCRTQFDRAIEDRDSWKARALRYEQVTAEVLEARTYGDGYAIGAIINALSSAESANRVARDIEAHVEELRAFARKVSVENAKWREIGGPERSALVAKLTATPPHDREPEGEKLNAGDRVLSCDNEYGTVVRPHEQHSGRVWVKWDSGRPDTFGSLGHGLTRPRTSPTPAAEQQEGGGNV